MHRRLNGRRQSPLGGNRGARQILIALHAQPSPFQFDWQEDLLPLRRPQPLARRFDPQHTVEFDRRVPASPCTSKGSLPTRAERSPSVPISAFSLSDMLLNSIDRSVIGSTYCKIRKPSSICASRGCLPQRCPIFSDALKSAPGNYAPQFVRRHRSQPHRCHAATRLAVRSPSKLTRVDFGP